MHMRNSKIVIFSAIVFSVFIFRVNAENKHGEPGKSDTESRVWLVGDSSLHAYSSMAHQLKIEFGFPSDKPVFEQLKTGQLKSLEVVIPVKEMRSGKDALDKNMQRALKADENPNILFHMEKYQVVPSTEPSGAVGVKAIGTLEVAGVKKDVVLDGILKQQGDDSHIEGVKDLLMTDFGVKPPRILLIKTSNEVRIHYDLRLDEKGHLK